MTTDATSPIANAPVIEMTGVTVGSISEGEEVVLEDVNWRVEAGEYWVIAGMHGSGKSGFMAMAGGLVPPQAGTYRLFGRAMPIYEEKLLPERLRLGLVFEDGHLFHQLTVEENLALPLQYHRNVNRHEAAGRVVAMLEWTGLERRAEKPAGALTRNWQKRVGLARALMLEPEVLLLDDPLGGMDPRHAAWWLDFLDKLSTGCDFLKGRRMTLVVTADDLRPWERRAGGVAILKPGRLETLDRGTGLAGHADPLVRELMAEGGGA